MSGKRLFGTLSAWLASEHGGYGYIDTRAGERFFTHRKFLKSGDPRPGASAVFGSTSRSRRAIPSRG